MLVLAGDVGGTSSRFALFEVHAPPGGRDGALLGDHVVELSSGTLRSRDFADLGAAAAQFLAGRKPTHAGFGVAGPVADNRCAATNLPWVIDASTLAQQLAVPHVRLLNDFEAVARGIPLLGPADLHWLQEVPPSPDAPIAILGAGTGLGEASMVPTQGGYRVLASEGGHGDFAPRSEREIGLLRHLLKRHEHVSYERVVSGPGLLAIYNYIIDARLAPSANAHAPIDTTDDPAAAIAHAALAGHDPACQLAVEMFVAIYGAEAGNLALKLLPSGGLFVAGGIAPKLLPLLVPGFVDAFLAKGRMRPVLERIPVAVITHARVGLLGALAAALA